jgi:hypothetical protein
MFAQLKSKASSILSAANSRRYRKSFVSREIDFVELWQMISTAFPKTSVTLTHIYPSNGAQYRLACHGLTDYATGNQVVVDLEVYPESLVIGRKLHYFAKGRMMPLEIKMIYKDKVFLLHLKQNDGERIIPETDFPMAKLDELTDRLFENQARSFLS